MPIEKGQSWGSPGELPADAPVLSTDAALGGLIGGSSSIVGLDSGDLARTLGIRSPYVRTGEKHLVPIDAIHVELDDGTRHVAVAHIVLGNLRTSSRAVAIMNAAFIGMRNVAPRAHPGDSKADVVDFSLSLGDRLKAWRRMTTASHLPHPDITVSRRSHGEVVLASPAQVRVDGVRVGRSSQVRYRVEPEAIIVAVS